MTRGKGWFQERGFDRTVFEIEIEEIVEGVVRGRVFNEVSPRGGKMPLSTISGTLNGEIIQAEKFYSGISHSHIYYRLKKRLHTCLAVRFLFTVARRLTSTACMRLPAEQWRLCLILPLNPVQFVSKRTIKEAMIGGTIIKNQFKKTITTFELIELNKKYLPETFLFSSDVKAVNIINN